jgi:DNA-binding response OmpR family regulator
LAKTTGTRGGRTGTDSIDVEKHDPLPADRVRTCAPLRVLIVEDGPTVAAATEAALRADGMITYVATTGIAAIAAKPSFHPDVVLVDLELPDVDGLQLVVRFSREADCGVIVVSVDGAEATRIAGLEAGADDFVAKPAALRELVARIRAVHRRLHRTDVEPPDPGVNLLMDPSRRLLLGPNETSVLLTEAEAVALEVLLDADGASVSREWISQTALKRKLHEDDRSVDQLMLKLRRKIASLGISERAILSARRHGYVIPHPGQFRMLPTPRADETAVRGGKADR